MINQESTRILPSSMARNSLTNNSLHRSLSSPDIAKSSNFSLQTNPETKSIRKTPDGSVSFESIEPQIRSLETPRLQLNGSLLSISNAQLMTSANKFMDYTRKASVTSQYSDTRRHLIFQNVGRTLQKTHSHLRKTKLLHVFYFIALPVYTLIGALLFQALDGEYDDRLIHEFEARCQENRQKQMEEIERICQQSGNECFRQMKYILAHVEHCYREWHKVNRTVTHPMSDFTNAVIYAFSVYTTIGYGNISANTIGCRIATVLYGICGIPLFFAFIKEEGNQGRMAFIWVYKKITDGKRWCCRRRGIPNTNKKKKAEPTTNTIAILVESSLEANPASKPVLVRKYSCESLSQVQFAGGVDITHSSTEQRRVFLFGVLVFVIYLLSASAFLAYTADWDYFTAFYFLFNSVALIGFGDVFPSKARVILSNACFIIFGVILFSMCYFILQEEIREKAFEASRKARMSISKYSQSLMLHTKNPWSRRNSPAFDRFPTSNGGSFERLRKRRQSAPAVTLNDSKTLLSFPP
uniref:Potassium channel domain-containing protein n=1 Tax=Panagrolaimus sp. JU765 TaxID=591449 RepID=A0AC34QCX4_9BILA